MPLLFVRNDPLTSFLVIDSLTPGSVQVYVVIGLIGTLFFCSGSLLPIFCFDSSKASF